MGGIVNGIEGLFGGSSADRNQQNSTNDQGQALTNQYNTIGNATNDYNQAGGNALGWSSDALQNQYNGIGNQQGAINNMNSAVGQQGGIAQSQLGLANQAGSTYGNTFGSGVNAMLGADGFTQGANGQYSYNSNFNPYSQQGNSLISQYSDSVAPQYQNSINATQHDLLSRGITGGNTIGPAQDAQTRQAQASDVANFGRNLGVQAANEQYSRLGNAMNLINGVGQTAQQGYGSAASTYGNQASGYGGVNSALSNQNSEYGSNAGGWNNLAGQYGQAGNDWLNQAGAYGNNASGYGNNANAWTNIQNTQNQALSGIPGLFSAASGAFSPGGGSGGVAQQAGQGFQNGSLQF